jgi:hypothetical protein
VCHKNAYFKRYACAKKASDCCRLTRHSRAVLDKEGVCATQTPILNATLAPKLPLIAVDSPGTLVCAIQTPNFNATLAPKLPPIAVDSPGTLVLC